MSRDPAVLLEDVAQAASEITGFIEGLEFEVFNDAIRTQRAVERSFEIIGEALNQLSRISPQLATRFPELRQAVDFRNQLAHGYHLIETQVVWDAAVNDISELRHAIQSLLAELD